jgi:hypothetical protein
MLATMKKPQPLQPLIPLDELKKVVGGLVAASRPEKPVSDSATPAPKKPE